MITEGGTVERSESSIAERLADPASRGFREQWARQPGLDVAEAVMRLRRLRGLSREELAELLGIDLPAVEEIESGRSDAGLNTLTRLAEVLGATVRVDLDPIETAGHGPRRPRWWEENS
jgi:ribosome-binding protein aMBF1 (putative translation factor)